MKKVLFVASVTRHILAFHLPFLKYFKEKGWQTEVASRGEEEIAFCDIHHEVNFERSPLKKENISAFRQLKKLIDDNAYDIIHCHTPVAALLTRLAARKARKKETKVYYTAHGFHFYQGAPLLNWLIYFPIEWMCSFFTDVLITINKEDNAFAQKHMHAKKVYYVPGVGINVEAIQNVNVDIKKKRKEMGVPEDARLLFSVGELNQNKNHALIINALKELNDKTIHYCIAGSGAKEEVLSDLAKEKNLLGNVHFLGQRSDVKELLYASDIFCFPSFREGLPVSVMEAMSAGLPCVATNIRGTEDLIKDGRNGILISPTDVAGAKDAIRTLIENDALKETMGNHNKEDVLMFSREQVDKEMISLYELFE